MATKKPTPPPPQTGKIAKRRATASTRRRTITDGAANQRSQRVADEIALGKRDIPEEEYVELPKDATPLDVLLMSMRRAYLIGGSIAAAPFAEKAAPYVHGKISSIELRNAAPNSGSGGDGRPVPFRVEFVDPAPRE